MKNEDKWVRVDPPEIGEWREGTHVEGIFGAIRRLGGFHVLTLIVNGKKRWYTCPVALLELLEGVTTKDAVRIYCEHKRPASGLELLYSWRFEVWIYRDADLEEFGL